MITIIHTHLDHIGFVSFENLDSLGCLWINDENTRVTSLSDQSLPTPAVHKSQTEGGNEGEKQITRRLNDEAEKSELKLFTFYVRTPNCGTILYMFFSKYIINSKSQLLGWTLLLWPNCMHYTLQLENMRNEYAELNFKLLQGQTQDVGLKLL